MDSIRKDVHYVNDTDEDEHITSEEDVTDEEEERESSDYEVDEGEYGDEETEYRPPAKKMKETIKIEETILNKWTEDDKLIWRKRFLEKKTASFNDVQTMIDLFPKMKAKMMLKYKKYEGKQKLNMLANTIRQYISRETAKLHMAIVDEDN